jgi:hypothetical protein
MWINQEKKRKMVDKQTGVLTRDGMIKHRDVM